MDGGPERSSIQDRSTTQYKGSKIYHFIRALLGEIYHPTCGHGQVRSVLRPVKYNDIFVCPPEDVVKSDLQRMS